LHKQRQNPGFLTQAWPSPYMFQQTHEIYPGTCLGATNPANTSSQELKDLFKERCAMVLGMNPHSLRMHNTWGVYLWVNRSHWAIVLQPIGQNFEARIADDFLHETSSVSTSTPSKNLFLVFELLVSKQCDMAYLMLSVKLNFDPTRGTVTSLGCVEHATFEEVAAQANEVIQSYKEYSVIGCNCQHFAADYARALDVPGALVLVTEDEQWAGSASENANLIGAAGAGTALSAVGCAAGAQVLKTAVPACALLAPTPLCWIVVALGALGTGVVGGLILEGASQWYTARYKDLRYDRDVQDTDASGPAKVTAAGGDKASLYLTDAWRGSLTMRPTVTRL